MSTYPNTPAGMASAMASVSGEQSRLWVDGPVIRILPAPVSAAPTEITPAQAKIALSRAGKLAAVEAAVTAAGGETRIWWNGALSFRRDHPAITAMGTAVGLSSADLDNLFTAAVSIS